MVLETDPGGGLLNLISARGPWALPLSQSERVHSLKSVPLAIKGGTGTLRR